MQWLIFSTACLIYANTIPNKWAIDDSIIIYQNKFVKRGISGIDSILTTDAFSGFYGRNVNAVSGGRYRPLTPVLFAVGAQLFASDLTDDKQRVEKDKAGFNVKDLSAESSFPNILHLFNMLWYGLLCLVLYRTLLLLLNQKKGENDFKRNFITATTSILFALHPLHTEVVANVKGLDEILALLGCLSGLYCLARAFLVSEEKSGQKTKWIVASAGFYFLALLSKESAVTFIAVIPLSLWFFMQASLFKIFRLMLPLVVALVVFLFIRTSVLSQPVKTEIAEELMNDPFLVLDPHAKYAPLLAGMPIQKLVNPNADTFTKMPYTNQLATNLYTYNLYLKLLTAPYPLTVDYYPRHIDIKSFTDISVLFSVLVHLFLLFWALFNIKKKNLIAFGILYYFITFSIFSNLFFPIGTNMAERFMFVPSVGFCLIISCLLFAFGNKLSSINSTAGFTKISVGVTAICLIYASLTINRNFVWKNNFTLFSKDILVSKNSGKINTDLASEYIAQAELLRQANPDESKNLSIENKREALKTSEKQRKDLLEKAVPLLEKALKIHPMSNAAWLKIANAFHFLGQLESNTPETNFNYYQTAIAAYQQAEFYKADGMEKAINAYKALCFMNMGKLMGQKFGIIPSAILYLEEARKLSPGEPEIYLLLGTANSMINNYEKTIEYTKKGLELRPDDRNAKENLAVAYQRFAYAEASRKDLLPVAETLLLEVYKEEKMLDYNNPVKLESTLRTLDLLYRNAVIQGNTSKQAAYKNEILKRNHNSLTSQTAYDQSVN